MARENYSNITDRQLSVDLELRENGLVTDHLLFTFYKIFLMWIIYEVFIELVQHCFCFGYEAHGNLALQLEINSTFPALESKIITTGHKESPLRPHLNTYFPNLSLFADYLLRYKKDSKIMKGRNLRTINQY